jgi:hypothetical protein
VKTDSLSDGTIYWTKIDTTVTPSTLELSRIIDTLYYDNPVAIIEQDNDPVNMSELLFAPNPVPQNAAEVFFVTPSALSGKWNITIFDNLGNRIDSKEFESNGGHTYSWDLTNEYGAPVASGTYMALLIQQGSDGTVKKFKRMIGVKR